MSVCKTCKTAKILKNGKLDDVIVSTNHKPLDPNEQWFPIEKIPNPDKTDFNPRGFNRKLEIKLGKSMAGRRIFYYGANARKFDNKLIKTTQRRAYGDWKNHGLSTVDLNGNVEISFICPQNYSTSTDSYISHIHFMKTTKGGKWENKLFTIGVICSVSNEELRFCMEKKCAVILNALSINEYIRARIPESHSLPVDKLLEKNTPQEIVKYIEVLCSKYPLIHRALSTEKIQLFDVPLILYCYSEKCNASDKLANKLWQLGFRNIKEYTPGITGYLSLTQ